MSTEITKEFTFEAAHHLPSVGDAHKCSRTHGHLFRVEVTVGGEIDPIMGWIIDFADLAKAGKEVIGALDHRVLNNIPGLENPTSENLAKYLFDRLAARIHGVTAVTVHESPTSKCTYRPGGQVARPTTVQIGVSGLSFAAAHILVFPNGEREPLHGHDYRVSVSAWIAGNGPDNAQEILRAATVDAIADLEHRVLIASKPAIGHVQVLQDVVKLVLPGDTVTLPRSDCTLIDTTSTATEALAALIAQRIADSAATTDLKVSEVSVSLLEGTQDLVKSTVKC